MALTTVSVSSTFYHNDSTPIDEATVSFVLSGPTYDIESPGVVLTSVYTSTTDSSGNCSVDLWPNDRGSNVSFYTVEVSYTSPETGKRRVDKVGKFQVPTEGAPHNLSELLAAGVPSADSVLLGLITQNQYDEIIAAKDSAAASAAEATQRFVSTRLEMKSKNSLGEYDALSDGTVVQAGDLFYSKLDGATSITDLPDFEPWGDIYTNHFGADPSLTDNSTAFQDCADYCVDAGIGTFSALSGGYNFTSGFSLDGAITFDGGDPNECELIATAALDELVLINHKYAQARNYKTVGANFATAGTAIAALGTQNCNIKVTNIRSQECDYAVLNKGADGIDISRVHSLSSNVSCIRSMDNFLNSSISDCYLYAFSDDGDAIVLDKDTHQPEGVLISGNITLTPGGRPIVINSGLSIDLIGNTFDQFDEGGLLDGGTNTIADVRMSNNWFGPKSGSSATAGLKITGGVTEVRVTDSTFVQGEFTGVHLATAGVQNVILSGNRFRITGTTSACIGFKNEGAKSSRVLANSFIGGSGSTEDVDETDTSTSMFWGNRFENADASKFSTKSLIGTNHGLYSSAANGTYTDVLDNGSITDPAVAFRADPTRGWYQSGSGVAWTDGANEVLRIDDDGLRVPRTMAIRGDAANISNNAAISFTPAYTTGIVTISTDEGCCEFFYRADGVAAVSGVATANAASVWAASTGILVGTTGTSGELTVSPHTDGNIYIENRRGSTKSVTVSVRR